MEHNQTKKFNLLTTIAMMSGIVIGSGIFFKADDILLAVEGNVMLGCFCFAIGAIGIIFGGLTIRYYAINDIGGVGGIITYCEMAFGKLWGYLTGWFQINFYLPAIIAIVSWIGACYTCVLFGLPGPFTTNEFSLISWLITIFYLVFFYIFNTLQTRNAGKFQSIAMILKIAALLVIAFGGLFWGNPIYQEFSITNTQGSSGIFTAIIAIAFSYDGWLVAPSIAHEIKNSKRNLPIALLVSPLLIMLIYIAYFYGINALVGSDVLLALKDNAVGLAGMQLFGSFGDKIIYTFIVISVLGTVNGLILGYIRLPYALAIRKEIPLHNKLSVVHPKWDIPIYSTLYCFILSLFWLFLHFLSTNGVQMGLSIFAGLAIDNLPIVMTYIFYCSLFLGVIKKYLNHQIKGIWQGLIFPMLALVGGAFVLWGGVITPNFNIYMLISFVGIILGLIIRPKAECI